MPHALEWTAEAREGGENLGLTLTSRVKHTCKSQARWPQAAAELNWNWKGASKGGGWRGKQCGLGLAILKHVAKCSRRGPRWP